MSLTTSQVVAETDLVGSITSPLTTVGLSFQAIFRDKKTGVARTPQATTLMFDIDQDNESHETILATSHSTTSGVTTVTIAANGRNLPKYGAGAGGATGLAHVVGASIGCVNIARPLNIIADEVVAKSGDTVTGDIIFSSTTKGGVRVQNLTTAERDALATVANGYIIYNTDDGEYQNYNGGTWYTFAAGSTQPDASETVAGKVEQATAAEQGASTETGGTGAPLFVNPKNLVKTPSGAADENKIAVLGSDGRHSAGFLNCIDGGTGADGALSVGAGTTTTLNLGQVYNFTTISVENTGTLTFTGTGMAIIKHTGAVNIAGTIELRNMVSEETSYLLTNGITLQTGSPHQTVTLSVGGAGGGAGQWLGGTGGTSTTASGTPGVGGAGGAAGSAGTAGSGGNSAVGGGGGGGAGATAGGSAGVNGSTTATTAGGAGGAGGANNAAVAASGGGGGGGGGYDTGNGGAGAAGGVCSFVAGVNTGKDGGKGGASGASGGTGGAGGAGSGITSTPTAGAQACGNGGNGGDGYTTGGAGGNGGSCANINSGGSTLTLGNGGNGGNALYGTGGNGGTGGSLTAYTAVAVLNVGTGGNGGNGRTGGIGGAGSASTYSLAGTQYNRGGTGGNGGNGSCGSAAFYMMGTGAVTLEATAIINAQGGNGGNGGTGGQNVTAVGVGGQGGNGGNGGNGSDIYILTSGTLTNNGLTVNNSGGTAGTAGAGGNGIIAKGSIGSPGVKGRDGVACIKQVISV